MSTTKEKQLAHSSEQCRLSRSIDSKNSINPTLFKCEIRILQDDLSRFLR